MVLSSSAHQSTDSRHDWWLRLPHLLGLTGATGHTSKFLSKEVGHWNIYMTAFLIDLNFYFI